MLISLERFGFSKKMSFKAEDIKYIVWHESSMQISIYYDDGGEGAWENSEKFDSEEELEHQFILLNDFINRFVHGEMTEPRRSIVWFPGCEGGKPLTVGAVEKKERDK